MTRIESCRLCWQKAVKTSQAVSHRIIALETESVCQKSLGAISMETQFPAFYRRAMLVNWKVNLDCTRDLEILVVVFDGFNWENCVGCEVFALKGNSGFINVKVIMMLTNLERKDFLDWLLESKVLEH